ncbi:hypothetical protein [Bacillus sp. E(2018)]|uniref:hypothetical protein n=1 Tax=Bacillus sp. E(2018) TaxID=2502239 RepID=UPI0010F90E1C|nr:hypothetical protein [Bacillus sp. E(2018)]
MKKTHLLFLIVLFSFGITGCSIAADGNDHEGEKSINDDFPPVMMGFVTVKGKKYEMEAGNYKWERRVGSETEAVSTDSASPSQIAEFYKPIEVEPGDDIMIEIQDDPKVSIYLFNENDRDKEVILRKNHFSVPSYKGRYNYEVLADWSNGEVSYTFVVEVH